MIERIYLSKEEIKDGEGNTIQGADYFYVGDLGKLEIGKMYSVNAAVCIGTKKTAAQFRARLKSISLIAEPKLEFDLYHTSKTFRFKRFVEEEIISLELIDG